MPQTLLAGSVRRYEVKVLREGRQIAALEYSAADELQAATQARRDGFEVLLVRTKSWQIPVLVAQHFSLLLFSQELRTLLDAGLPLLEALRTLAEKERGRDARRVLEKLVVMVSEGHTFSRALEQFSEIFPSLFIATISASERTGDMSSALYRYVAYQQQLNEIKKKALNALIYPSLLFVVGGLVGLFLLTYVMPKFAQIYEDRATALSWSSRLLVQWGGMLEGRAYLVVLVLIACVIAMVFAIRSPSVRERLLEKVRRIPAMGERLRLYQLTRFYRTASMLLRSGIPLVESFEMSAGMLHADLRPRLARAVLAIRQGLGVSQSLERQQLTTPVVMRMLSVGERSGNMGEMMERAAAFHDEEIARWVEWFSRLFEPLLMAVIGLVIGAIVVAMYMPVFELVGEVR
jgi:general secretion pathway protein F